jgi:hypothetical protein
VIKIGTVRDYKTVRDYRMGYRLGIKEGVYNEKESKNASLFNCKTQNGPTSRNFYIQKA